MDDIVFVFFFFKQKTAYEMRISDWSSDVCSSDLVGCVRAFHLKDGGFIREKLLALSDYDFSCTYSILESPMGVENYVATLKLTPVTDGDRTFAEWSASFECAPDREAELVADIGGNVFQGGFQALTNQFSVRGGPGAATDRARCPAGCGVG